MATRQQIEPSVGVKVIYSSTYTYKELLDSSRATYGDIIIESKSGGGGLLHIYDASFYFSGYDNGNGDKTNQDGYVLTTRVNTGDIQITGDYTGNAIHVNEIEGTSLVTTDAEGNKVVIANIIYDEDLKKYVIDYGENAITKQADLVLGEDSLNEIIKQLGKDIDAAPEKAYNLVSGDLQDINKRVTKVQKDLSTALLNAEASAGKADASIKTYVDKNDTSLSGDILAMGKSLTQIIKDVSTALYTEDGRLDASIKDLVQTTEDLDKQYTDLSDAVEKMQNRIDNSVNVLAHDVSAIQDYIKSGVTDTAMRGYVDASVQRLREEMQQGDASVFNKLSPMVQETSARINDVSGKVELLQQHVESSVNELKQQIEQYDVYSYSTTGHTVSDTQRDNISSVKEAIDVLLENCYYTNPEAIQATFEVFDSSYIIGSSEPVVFTFSIKNYSEDAYTYTYSNPDELQSPKTFNGITSFGALAIPNTELVDLIRSVKIEYTQPDEHGNLPDPFESTLTCTATRAEFYAQASEEKTQVHDIQQLFYNTQHIITGRMGIYNISDIKISDGEFFYIAVYSHDGVAPVLDAADYSESIDFTYVDTLSFNYGMVRGAYDIYQTQITNSNDYILSYKKQSSGSGGAAELYWEDI